MRCLISHKNRILENEKDFLEEQHRRGFKLTKRGWLFYHFTPAVPGEVAYEIDLLSKKIADDDLAIDGWEMIETQSIWYKRLKKVYYLSSDPENRLVVDEKLRLHYYSRNSVFVNTFAVWLCIFIFLGIPIPTSWSDAVINAVYLIYFMSLVLSIVVSIRARVFKLSATSLSEKLGLCEETFITYFVQIKDLTNKEKNEADEMFSIIGNIQQYGKENNVDYYYVRSAVPNSKKLRQEVLSVLSIENERLDIMSNVDMIN